MIKIFKIKKKKEAEKPSLPNPNSYMRSFNETIYYAAIDPRMTQRELVAHVQTAVDNKLYAIMVPSCFVDHVCDIVHERYNDCIMVTSVIDFPLGSSTIAQKKAMLKMVAKSGAQEVDYVINMHRAKDREFSYITHEAKALVKTNKKVKINAIIEAAYFDNFELAELSKALVKGKVNSVVSSTGYAPNGVEADKLEIVSNVLDGTKVVLRAQGGIKTRAQAESYLRSGATFIGTSRII